jgi:flagellar biosynthesis GTPase FlhF
MVIVTRSRGAKKSTSSSTQNNAPTDAVSTATTNQPPQDNVTLPSTAEKPKEATLPASEATTILGSPGSDDDDDYNDDAVVLTGHKPAAAAATNTNNNTTSTTATEPPRPLEQRVPKAGDVLKHIRSSHHVQQLFSNSQFYKNKEAQDIFFNNEELWGDVANMMTSAIQKYTPKNEKDIKKKTLRFENKKRKINQKYIGRYELFENTTESGSSVTEEEYDDKYWEMRHLLPLIGIMFIKWFQKLITPPRGKERVPIQQQIENEVELAINQDVTQYFDKTTAQHVYYIIGFFCNAGAKEAERRTKDNDVGACIKAINEHFAVASEEEAVTEIKSKLPEGLTLLVDSRCSFGGLKYPDLTLYTVFAVIEKVYSTIATPINFTMFGGTLLSQILDGVLHNNTVVKLFTDLFTPNDKFSSDTISSTLQYYLKVFGNVRAKDLCYRYNSNLHKSATVGLRPSLAGGVGRSDGDDKNKQASKKKRKRPTKKATTKKKKGKEKKKQSSKKKEETTTKKKNKKQAREPEPQDVEQPNVEEEEEEEEADEDEYESSDDEPEIYEENVVEDDVQHITLQQLAEQDMEDNEDYRKDCTIDRKAEEYMGKVDTDEEDEEAD